MKEKAPIAKLNRKEIRLGLRKPTASKKPIIKKAAKCEK